MRLGDLDDLKVHISELLLVYSGEELANAILNAIDNAETVEEDKIIQCHSMESKSYLDGFKKGYKQAILDGKTNFSRPKGEWVLAYCSCGDRYYTCSICNRVIEVKNGQSLKDYPFCHCGAKMKGGKE